MAMTSSPAVMERIINLSSSGVSDFADLLNLMSQDGDDVVITFSGESTIVLEDVDITTLDAMDFSF